MIAFLLVLAVGFLTVFVLGTIWINFNSLPNWVHYIPRRAHLGLLWGLMGRGGADCTSHYQLELNKIPAN